MCGGLEGQLRPGIFRCSCFYKVIWSKVPSFESYFGSFTKVARVGCWCLEKVMTMDWFADVTLNFLWYQAKFFFWGSSHSHHRKRCWCCVVSQSIVIFIFLPTKTRWLQKRKKGIIFFDCDFHFPINQNFLHKYEICSALFVLIFSFSYQAIFLRRFLHQHKICFFCLRRPRRPPSCWIQCRLAWRWEQSSY